MVAAISFFAVLVMKEVSLPSPVMLAIAAIGGFALLTFGVRSPEIPLYLLVAYLPFSRTLVGDFGTQATAFNLTNLLMVWILVANALKRTAERKSMFGGSTPLNPVVFVFCLLGAVSLLRTSWEQGAWYIWEYVTPLKRWLTPVLFYFLTLWVVRDKRVFKTVAILIMVAVTAVAVMAIRDYMWFSASNFEKSRVGGIMDSPNDLGAFFVYYMFLMLGFLLIFTRRLWAWLLLIPFGLCFRGIMVTFSRGAYLAFAAGGLGVCWFRNKLLFLAAVGALCVMLANPVLFPKGVRYRFGMTFATQEVGIQQNDLVESLGQSSATRLEIWSAALSMIQKHPVQGVGYGRFRHSVPEYSEGALGPIDAHNAYLLIAAEMGIPTLLVFLLVLGMVCYYARWLYWRTSDRAVKAIALGFLGGLTGLWVANFFGSRVDSQELVSYFWILSGLVMRGVLMERSAGGESTPRLTKSGTV